MVRILVTNYSNAFFWKNILSMLSWSRYKCKHVSVLKHDTIQAYKVVEVQFHTFLKSALDRGEYLHVLIVLYPKKLSHNPLSIQEKRNIINMADTS